MKIYEMRDVYQEYNDLIDNGSTDEFLQFAKKYDLSETGTQFYNYICDKIKERLDRENLSHDILKPE